MLEHETPRLLWWYLRVFGFSKWSISSSRFLPKHVSTILQLRQQVVILNWKKRTLCIDGGVCYRWIYATTISLFFSLALVFVDAVQQSTSKLKKKNKCSGETATASPSPAIEKHWMWLRLLQVCTITNEWSGFSHPQQRVSCDLRVSLIWQKPGVKKKKKREQKAWRWVCFCVFLSECVKMCSMCLWVFACVLLPAAMCVQYELQ